MTIDRNKNQFIEFDELVYGLKDMGINVNYAEAFTLLKKFDTNKDFRLDVRELFEGLKRFVNEGVAPY